MRGNRHDPSFSRVQKIAQALGLELYIGPPREVKNLNKIEFNSEIAGALGLPDEANFACILDRIAKIKEENRFQHKSAALLESLEKLLNRYDQPSKNSNPKIHVLEDNSVITLPHPSARPVAAIEYEAAAGGGRINLDNAPQKGMVWFRRDWLDEHGVDPTQCIIMRVAGESMEPTLVAGCSIMVDRTRAQKKMGYIYVVLTDDGLVVKRLGKNGNMWQLLSDNPAWSKVAWPDNAEVVGQVMWTSKWIT